MNKNLQSAGQIRLTKRAGVIFDRIKDVFRDAAIAANNPTTKRKVVESMLSTAGKIGIGVAAAGTLYGVNRLAAGAANTAKKIQYLNALERVQMTNPVLKSIPIEELRKYGDTLFKFAPNVCTDPNMLSTLLINAVHGEGIDLTTIKTLVDLEDKYAGHNFQVASMIAKG